jgi:HEPN domain-containing protein
MGAPDAEAARAWWVKVESDLDAARVLVESDHPDVAVYLCQQAAEKALKALLTYHAIEFEKTHDLTRLLDEGTQVDTSLDSLREAARGLSPYATLYRYPGDVAFPPPGEAEEALEWAQEVASAIGIRLRGVL